MFETTPISALLGKIQNNLETGQDPIQQNSQAWVTGVSLNRISWQKLKISYL